MHVLDSRRKTDSDFGTSWHHSSSMVANRNVRQQKGTIWNEVCSKPCCEDINQTTCTYGNLSWNHHEQSKKYCDYKTGIYLWSTIRPMAKFVINSIIHQFISQRFYNQSSTVEKRAQEKNFIVEHTWKYQYFSKISFTRGRAFCAYTIFLYDSLTNCDIND